MISRLIPHPTNFTAMGAFVIIGSGFLSRQFIIPLLAMAAYFMTDLFLNNVIYSSYFEGFTLASPMLIYAGLSYLFIYLMARLILRVKNWKNLVFAGFLSALIFFLISNFGVWHQGFGYPTSWEGLVSCYMAAIPFFAYDFVGTLLFSAAFVLFYNWYGQGSWTLVKEPK